MIKINYVQKVFQLHSFQLCTDSISITLFSNYVHIVFQLHYFQLCTDNILITLFKLMQT